MVGMDGDVSREQVASVVPGNMSRQVHVIGGLAGDEIRSAWMAVDAFVSLSFRENFGYIAAEALSYGLSVVLSAGHDLAYEMPQGPDGRLACGWLLGDNSPETATRGIADAWTLFAGIRRRSADLVILAADGLEMNWGPPDLRTVCRHSRDCDGQPQAEGQKIDELFG